VHGFFFDSIIRQEPIDDNHLNPEDNLEEFQLLSEADLKHFETQAALLASSDRAVVGGIGGTAFGDIALVPAPFLKNPKGIRDITEWYMSPLLRPDFLKAIYDKQCSIALQNIETLINLFGDLVQAAVITGTDFGTQRGLFISLDAYREFYKPYHEKVNSLIHSKSNWKTFIHSCGSNWNILPDFVEAGFDIFNPVQCSAANMDPKDLKTRFGRDITFWGGGINTQKTLPFGTPEQVRDEVRQRIEIFGPGGGFVFNAIHNIQGDVPLKNVLAMFEALREYA
jgi:uroporphyrinogen-III decarboxylase